MGSPMPRISEVHMVRKRVSSRLPWLMAMMTELKRMPSPVRVSTPMTTPAVAQAMATWTAPLAPDSRAWRMRSGVSQVSRRMKLTPMVTTMAHRPAFMGLWPRMSR